jgi:Lrp/AsnC family transcriptional regulator, leucine-responsive regulatory protein
VFDRTDQEILTALTEDARVSFRELGERVGLSANAAAERVRRLQRTGVIEGFRAEIDPGAAGRRLCAIIDVRLASQTGPERFETAVARLAAITDADHVTGRFDYQLRVVCEDAAELDRTIRALKADAGATETDTRIILRTALRRSARLPGAVPAARPEPPR